LGDANLIAAVMNILLPLAIYWLFNSKSKVFRIVLTIYVAGIFVVHYLASSRGGLLAMVGEVGTFAILWGWLIIDKTHKLLTNTWEWLAMHKFAFAGLGLGLIVIIRGVGIIVSSYQGGATHAPVASARSEFWGAAIDAFKSNPIAGIGLGIYPSAYMLRDSMPPGRPFLHAHSIFFTFLAETGLVGIAGLTILTIQIIRAGFDSFQINRDNREKLKRWIVVCAVLIGVGIHGLVDDFIVYFVFGIPVLYFMATWIGDQKPETKDRKGFSGYFLIIVAGHLTAYTVYSQYATYFHEEGIKLAEIGDWESAAKSFDNATEIDPGMGLYWQESAIAHSQITNNDKVENLQKSIDYYIKAISIEPNFSANYANLATLYWEAGERDLSIEQLKLAIKLAPRAEWYWLTLNYYASISDDRELQEEAKENINKLKPNRDQEKVLEIVIAGIDDGDIKTAENEAVAGWERNNQEPLTYLALAMVEKNRGNLKLADKYLQAGFWVQTTHNEDKIKLLVYQAQVLQEMGEESKAQEILKMVRDAVLETTMYGWGSKGFTPYAWFVYQRSSLPVDIVPQFPRMDISEDF
jgi:Tfp pilus assembly protein PilF